MLAGRVRVGCVGMRLSAAASPRDSSEVKVAAPSGLCQDSATFGRRAFADNPAILQSSLGAYPRLAWVVLASHVFRPGARDTRIYTGECVLKYETLAREMGGVSPKTARRAINELLRANWICLPGGDAGGRGNATTFHLHPDGKVCALGPTELKQRSPDANKHRALANRAARAYKSKAASLNVDPGSTFDPSDAPKVDVKSTFTEAPEAIKVDCASQKVDREDFPYKEEHLPNTVMNAAAAGVRISLARFPNFVRTVHGLFPATDLGTVCSIIDGALAVHPGATDAELTQGAMETLRKGRDPQRSARLWLDTLPAYFETHQVLNPPPKCATCEGRGTIWNPVLDNAADMDRMPQGEWQVPCPECSEKSTRTVCFPERQVTPQCS